MVVVSIICMNNKATKTLQKPHKFITFYAQVLANAVAIAFWFVMLHVTTPVK